MFRSHNTYLLFSFSKCVWKKMPSDSHVTVIVQSSYSHQTVIRQSLGSHQAVIRQSSDSHQTVTRQSSDSHQTVIKQSSDSHQTFIHRLTLDLFWDTNDTFTTFAGWPMNFLRTFCLSSSSFCVNIRPQCIHLGWQGQTNPGFCYEIHWNWH